MNPELRVAVDVGFAKHHVAVGLSDGALIDEFRCQPRCCRFELVLRAGG